MKFVNFALALFISFALTITVVTAIPTYDEVKKSIESINTNIQQFAKTTPTKIPFNDNDLKKLEENIQSVQTVFQNSKTIILEYRDGHGTTLTSAQVTFMIQIYTGTITPFKNTLENIIAIQAPIAALNASEDIGKLLQAMFEQISQSFTAFTNIIQRDDIERFEKATVELEDDAVAACKKFGGSCY